MESVDWVQKAFIDPIRTVVLVDDEFPAYGEDPPNPGGAEDGTESLEKWRKNRDRAKLLTDSCRERFWTCDVVGGPDCRQLPVSVIEKADVVILDYHLGTNARPEESALDLVAKLAEAQSWRVVVMYSWEEPAKVLAAVRKRLEVISERVGVDQEGQDAEDESTDGRPWIQVGGVFVTAANKGDGQLDAPEIVRLLGAGLRDWNPDPITRAQAYARWQIVQRGDTFSPPTKQDAVLRAAWLYQALAGEPARLDARLSELWRRVLETDLSAIAKDVAEFGNSQFPEELTAAAGSPRASRVMEYAREAARVKASDENVVHALNVFLATEPYGNYHLTTGTVFTLSPEGEESSECKEVWICTTAACDLVPEQRESKYEAPDNGNGNGKRHKWGGHAHPWVPILAVRAQVIAVSQHKKALKDAAKSRHLFLQLDMKPVVLEVLAGDGLADIDVLMVENNGRTNEGLFAGMLATGPGQPTRAGSFKVVGQLRAQYASRLLSNLGHQVARLGVDFAHWPVE